MKEIIFVISDSIGETAELMAKYLIDKYPVDYMEIRKFSYILEKHQIDEILTEVKMEDGIIIYTMVSPEIKGYLKDKSESMGLLAIDIMGPVIDILSRGLKQKPALKAGLNRKLDDEYFRRISAIEFAMKYDDSIGKEGFNEADIILIGVSRTGKTPLSMYLAARDYKVANFPITLNVELPKEIYKVDPKKIIGLTSSVDKINQIRSERLNVLGLEKDANYSRAKEIQRELDYAEKLMSDLGCKIIDISDRAIEETATSIINQIERDRIF